MIFYAKLPLCERIRAGLRSALDFDWGLQSQFVAPMVGQMGIYLTMSKTSKTPAMTRKMKLPWLQLSILKTVRVFRLPPLLLSFSAVNVDFLAKVTNPSADEADRVDVFRSIRGFPSQKQTCFRNAM